MWATAQPEHHMNLASPMQGQVEDGPNLSYIFVDASVIVPIIGCLGWEKVCISNQDIKIQFNNTCPMDYSWANAE